MVSLQEAEDASARGTSSQVHGQGQQSAEELTSEKLEVPGTV